jgi:hypothetical protein
MIDSVSKFLYGEDISLMINSVFEFMFLILECAEEVHQCLYSKRNVGYGNLCRS